MNILKALRYIRWYVLADPRDNSITFSRSLYRHIVHHAGETSEAKVFAFYIPSARSYGFIINPDLKKASQVADIQYNDRYRTIGFESLCPTVNRIFYDYQLLPDTMHRLSVTPRHTADGTLFYQIERPS